VSSSARPQAWQALHKLGLIVTLAGTVLICGAAHAKETPSGTISRAQLPTEALATERLIRSGGPFKSPKDGVVFGNRERILPSHPRGFYREYTVATPGARNRGARRIVCGGTPPTAPQACYYSADHYATFQRIVP
jgi:ribonuclease T1